MARFFVALVSLAACLLGPVAMAQGVVKIGVILPYSGQFADTATQVDNGIRLYLAEHGDTVAGKKIEIVRKDVGGVAPDVAKRLAQELVVRDKVDMLAGFVLTPNALAASDVSVQAKKPMIIMNAATSIITTKSPYSARVSLTLPQVCESLGHWAAKNGISQAYTMVSDYAPGHDAEQAFQRAFKADGGTVVGEVRFPVNNPDFSAFVQRAKDANPQSIFIFVPAGEQPAALMKTFSERGVLGSGIKILGTGEAVSDAALKSMGDVAIGIITASHYDREHQTRINQDFVRAYQTANGGLYPDFLAVGGYDGMHLVYEALKKTSGNTDADAFIGAVKGLSWESPRGPVEIDPETRDIIQTIYIRKVGKVEGQLANVEFDKIPRVKDPVKAAMTK